MTTKHIVKFIVLPAMFLAHRTTEKDCGYRAWGKGSHGATYVLLGSGSVPVQGLQKAYM